MIIEVLVNGITLGSIYCLAALGFNMIFGVLKMLNFAHGEILMFGTFVFFTMVSIFKIPLILAIILTIVITGLMGVLLYLIAYKPVLKGDAMAPLLSSLGVSIMLEALGQLIWGTEIIPFPINIPKGTYSIASIKLSNIQIFIFLFSITLMIILYKFIMKSNVGLQIRALSYNRKYAELMGIETDKITMIVFSLATILAMVSGILSSMYYDALYVTMGSGVMIKAFAAAILGGIGSIPGALVGGYILGVSESLVGAYISTSYVDGIAFIILVLVLIIKPNGIFGEEIKEKV
ncbi:MULTISPECIES: branched-chain amino acid ABC transporter permease [Clostridium]|uniref:Branched-chain amino acid ABC transporter permease n=1 Tax=Clostridium botulinum TaxID=1491 RepID=A0AAU8YYZ2_CLOBO|nr:MULTISPECIES: branched-chain amino acid ABC transporter permease [Clostridium]AVP65718.1 branched-chain amino acid ABC transporter permease [Clostridium botulinum]EHN16468.1 high-affinity branched-chain amino acid ABC transporter, permease protein [Clostridium sporogenes PA 3679]KOY67622.1 branched-chain amino acid ABC transporter permease [Clostridium sporogenes]KYN75689.1 branched-chain amino acid ABC transporter permease [Clostridium sporogenes]MBE6058486.1 branched-chain amino acid ABC 